eukprot:CAMPEP_0168354230 /NCGR_PEP_ID=MMETSP0213-20121227/23774_1 /TAXON_ID=151035 /ORGANISM="Euplotes harpa, Strain FSP1.4" /LENGTH=246 /DNA_ID=CAMNT_0008366095 /DNA_START=654 /DNA_END=1394 /DNA_ORIENTATION=-
MVTLKSGFAVDPVNDLLVHHFFANVFSLLDIFLDVLLDPVEDLEAGGAFDSARKPAHLGLFHLHVSANPVREQVEFIYVENGVLGLFVRVLPVVVLIGSGFEDTIDAVFSLLLFDELVDSVVDARHVGQVPDAGPLHRVLVEHGRDQHPHVHVELFAHHVRGLVDDFVEDALDGVCIERLPQQSELIEDAADGPDVSLFAVRLSFADLRRHVVWCSDVGERKVGHGIELLGYTEITYFEYSVFRQK